MTEYILKSNTAFWWLKEGSRLCYAEYDNSVVDRVPYILYGKSNFSTQLLKEEEYPKIYEFPYPKPGREMTRVTLKIVDFNSAGYIRDTKFIKPPKELSERGHYLTAPVVWITRNAIFVIWSNRMQNLTIASICSEDNDWYCQKVIEEPVGGKGWLMVNDAPIFTSDKKYFFMRLPIADGLAGTYNHIAQISIDGSKKYFLTHGKYEVTKIFTHRSNKV